MDFKIISISRGEESFTVMIEIIETMERMGFAYPYGNGWEDKEDGEFRFLENIKERLKEAKQKKDSIEPKKFTDIDKLKGNIFKAEPKEKIPEGGKQNTTSA